MRKELWCSPGYYYQRYYEVMLEAVDADEVKFYQAQVAVDSVDDRMWLEVFCVMDDEHYSLRLYHHLGNHTLIRFTPCGCFDHCHITRLGRGLVCYA